MLASRHRPSFSAPLRGIGDAILTKEPEVVSVTCNLASKPP